jgi:hypothetical protein
MKRLGLAVAIVAALSMVNPAVAGAGTVPGSDVYVVHGIGEALGQSPVDVYVREEGAVSFSLLIAGQAADFGFGSVVTTALPAGEHTILVCQAAAAPLNIVNECADNAQPAVNGNSGNPVIIPAGETVALFIGFGEAGRPEVLPFPLDLSCVEGAGTGRATAGHGADAGPVDVLLDGTLPIVENLANGESVSLDVPAGSYDIVVSDGGALDLPATLDVEAQQNNVAFVTGDPDLQLPYTIVELRLPVEVCDEPLDTTTTTAPAAQQVTTPRLTG